MADSAFRDRMLAATRVVREEERTLKKRIGKLYEDCAADLEKTVTKYGMDGLTGKRADALQKSMRAYTHQLWSEVEELASSAVHDGARLAVTAQTSMLDDLVRGIGYTSKPSFSTAFARTQDEAVASVLNGSIYAGKNASLSKRIWNNEALQNGQIENLIASAVAEGRSAPELAKDLQAYVNPKALMPDHWNDVYPCPFNYAVDFNAKRLAVTALNHGYYLGTIMAARGNPFAEFIHWEVSSMHLIYDICDTYQEHDEGLGIGNYALDNAPLPHPFCRCTWYVDSAKSLEEIGDEIGRWIAGEENLRMDAAFAEWEGTNGLANSAGSGTINLPDIPIKRGVGAKHASAFSFDAPDGNGEIFSIPGEYIRDVKVIAGKGTNVLLRDRWNLENTYHVPASEWQKVKGRSWVQYLGEEYYGELHWYQSEATGRVEYKLKLQPDGRWWLDER